MAIFFNESKINNWYYYDDNITKVYRNGAVCYYKITGGGGTQVPCYAVVDDISQYQETEFEDVFNKADGKWYKLNNLNQYEKYGIYGSGRTITTYDGKLTIDGDYEYQYSGSSWVNVGEVSGSTALEYIERTSTYNGYMPLGAYFTENTVIQIDFQMTQAKGNAIIGDYGSNDNDDWRVFLNYDSQVNNWLVYDFINSRNYYNTGDWSKRFNIEIGNYYIKDLDTGNYLINTASKTGFSRPNQMYLFHMDGTQNTNNIDYGKIYSVKIYQNNVLVKDYVPWTDGNGNYGLYDNVSSSATQSIGSMTGETSGTIEYPIYYDDIQDPPNNLSFSSMTEAEEYECPWVGMNATIDGDKYIFSGNSTSGYEWVYQSSRLPSGYTEVEYIENESVAYINTSFKPNQDTRVIARMQTVTSMMHARFLGAGAWNGSNGYQFDYENYYDGELHISWGAINGWSTYNYYGDYSAHTYDWNKNVFTIDNGVFSAETTYTSFQCTDNLGLFVHIYNGEPCGDVTPWSEGYERSFLHGRLYSCQIYDNGTLVRDFVPCIRDSDSKAGVYDIVNDVFYSSAYSGYEFTAGPSV